MIKNFRMNWETEEHTFTFHTGGSRLASLDVLSDMIGSLQALYDEILKDYDNGEQLPDKFRVRGGSCHTIIKKEGS